jgi:hypothetical protein
VTGCGTESGAAEAGGAGAAGGSTTGGSDAGGSGSGRVVSGSGTASGSTGATAAGGGTGARGGTGASDGGDAETRGCTTAAGAGLGPSHANNPVSERLKNLKTVLINDGRFAYRKDDSREDPAKERAEIATGRAGPLV